MSRCIDDKPRVRWMQPELLQVKGETFVSLRDPAGIQADIMLLSPLAYQLTQLMDGLHSRPQILEQARERWGVRLQAEQLDQLLNSLEERYVLDNATSRGYLRDLACRPAAHAGSAYPADPRELAEFLNQLIGSEAPREKQAGSAYLIPHIDLRRGRESYAQAYRHARSSLEDFDLFVILGITHAYSHNPFVLTRKDFETPLGRVETDQDLVEKLAADLPFDPFLDEFNHLGEHSIEFQLVFLQHLRSRPVKIVPILCGSFQECLETPRWPEEDPRVAAFLERLGEVVPRSRTCWLASVDLAHMGQRFDGPPLSVPALQKIEERDRESIAAAVAGDARGFLATLQADRGQRNYCGTSAIYSLLQVLKPGSGTLLNYQQCNEPGLTSTVTVASVSFP
ncbi:MAG: AmmeMemoRadiSam system protein B [Candidatus Eremiobacteraeota bacterium]|nr:AmmeMemoRadiSam system protein B [Candidatus Eremiobacteraeota bacterium]MCW5872068.1 AmmeMemoRadiSam system protein B [Candidatus Eremiobacteraeota bacterium]